MVDGRRALLVAALAVLAGCSAVVGPGGQTATPTGDATPTPTPTATATPPPRSTPPAGVTVGGVTDPFLLAQGHAEELVGHTVRRVTVVTAPNGTVLGRRVTVVRADAGDRHVYHLRRTRTGEVPGWYRGARFLLDVPDADAVELELYSNETVAVARVTADGTTSYRRVRERPWEVGYLDAYGYIVTVFGAVDTRVTDVSQRNGTTYYTLRSTEGPHDLGGENVTGVRLFATVRADGVVTRLSVSVVNRSGDRPVRVTRRVAFSDVGTTSVSRPTWVEAALENTTARGG